MNPRLGPVRKGAPRGSRRRQGRVAPRRRALERRVVRLAQRPYYQHCEHYCPCGPRQRHGDERRGRDESRRGCCWEDNRARWCDCLSSAKPFLPAHRHIAIASWLDDRSSSIRQEPRGPWPCPIELLVPNTLYTPISLPFPRPSIPPYAALDTRTDTRKQAIHGPSHLPTLAFTHLPFDNVTQRPFTKYTTLMDLSTLR